MEKITAEDLQKIATLLQVKAGISIVVLPNDSIAQGKSFLIMNPNDVQGMKEIFEPAQPQLNFEPGTITSNFKH